MNTVSLLMLYQQVFDLSNEMNHCAQQERWNDLMEVEKSREAVLGKCLLDSSEYNEPSEIAVLIKRTLDVDADTSKLIRAWMKEIELVLNSTKSSRKLQQVYGGSVT